jgi:hypothetical protein
MNSGFQDLFATFFELPVFLLFLVGIWVFMIVILYYYMMIFNFVFLINYWIILLDLNFFYINKIIHFLGTIFIIFDFFSREINNFFIFI